MNFGLLILPVFFAVLVVPVAFGEEKEELVYFSLDENPEVVKETCSDAFWENPTNTPPMLFLIAIAGVRNYCGMEA